MTVTTTFRLVKPGDLNHHDTLFAGRLAEWLIEACFIGVARILGETASARCTRIDELSFNAPLKVGDLVELDAEVARLGRTSIVLRGTARKAGSDAPCVRGLFTFVTVDAAGKARPHKLS